MAVCCKLIPHKPYRLPQHYNRHVCGSSCSCKHRFYGYLRFLSISLSQLYEYGTPLTTFLVNNQSSLHSPVLIFQPTVNCMASDKQGELCLEQHYSLRELHSCYVLTYASRFLEWFRRWRWSILATQRNPDLHGSCSLPKHCGISDRSEQNSSKLQRTVCNVFRSHSAI